MAKTGLKSTLTKGLGVAGKVFSLLDTVAMVDKVSKNTAPILEKAIDRHHERQEGLVLLPDVTHLPLEKATSHLESLGLDVVAILAKPNQLNKHSRPGEIVAMLPKTGKLPAGSLVKLYYATSELLAQESDSLTLNQVLGLPVQEAVAFLKEGGFKVVAIPAHPNRKYALNLADTVVDTEPKSSLLKSPLKRGSLIKLFYLTQEVLNQSQTLENDHLAQKAQQKQAVVSSIEIIKDLSQQSLQTTKQFSQGSFDKVKSLFKDKT